MINPPIIHFYVSLYLILQYICTPMEKFPDFLPFEDEQNNHLIKKFTEMRSKGAQYYFDVEEFEQLIDFYLFDTDQSIIQELIALAKGQHPGSTSISIKEAEVLAYSENTDRAVEIIESITLYQDSNLEHFFSKASVYSLADKKDKAIEVLQTLVDITENEDQQEARMALAKEYQENGDFNNAISQYQYILTDAPDDEDAMLELSLTCELGGQLHQGINIISDFIDENPYSHFAWFSLGNMYMAVENYEKSINAYEYATLINEKFIEAFFNLGNVYMKIERFEDAIEAYKSSLVDELVDPITYNFIGHCYIVLEQNEQAIEYFRKAVEQNPEYSDGWLGFAVAYSNINQFRDALFNIEKAIKLAPGNMYYHYFNADILFNSKDFEGAEKLYERVYESDINASGIFLDYAEALITNEKHKKALQVLVDGITQFPDESILYYRYSALMLKLGNELDAESILMLALEIAPDQSSQLFEFFPEAGKFEGIMDLIENYK